MSLAVGARLGAYEILGAIGAGGMGTVYRARDTRLGRTVAIKVIKDVAADPHARNRLVREAQHASALNHPNICTIHEIGDLDGQPFIVMELVEGRRLHEVVGHDGLPLDRVVGYGVQIADAVAHAHDHGIIHHDLKALNVIVTPEDRVKILDFGLATRTWYPGAEQAPTLHLTRPDVIAGTVAYMAPELLLGKPADVRSDIWALGAMIYELTTGRLPFGGDTEYEVSARILREPPQPLPSRVAAALAAMIDRCLMKDPEQRYQRAADVRAALEASAKTEPAASLALPLPRPRPAIAAALAAILAVVGYLFLFSGRALAVSSIAVVPFVNVGNNPDTEYLSDGITESVINSLAQLPQTQLKVIALSSVLQYKGRQIDPQAMGRELAVETLVIGRVVQRPDVLSVSAELVNVRDKSRIWGETYNTKIADVLSLQRDLAAKISDNLRLRLDNESKKLLTKRYAENVEAYQLYLKGRYLWNKYTEDGWTKAIDYFRQAIAIEPGFALAWAGLADSYYQLSSVVLLPSEAIPKARAAALKSLELDDTLAEAHVSLGMIKSQYDWDRRGAEREFKRAIALNPNYATAHHWFGQYYLSNGQFNDSLIELRRASEIDPFSVSIALISVGALQALGRHEDALRLVTSVMDMHPETPVAASLFYDVRGQRYLMNGMFDAAVADLVRGYEMNFVTGGGPEAIKVLTEAYNASGITGFWQKELELAIASYRKSVEEATHQSPTRYVSPCKLAGIYVRAGDTDRAFALLEEAYTNRDENLLWLKAESLSAGSQWRSVASDPRLLDLIKRLGLG